ncbi:Hsp70 family protein [Kibdelosporangium phytohabitans]|uniref:Molecular chaperone DnaK n=1 Tax=Kibdelosporangium phytohabitans TaxID=860235 RepID=A0A0N9I2M1_9PSEU|nr:Hsp70 family protein [Kibdelosporangium phytohabitans]ALG10281.1 hypothetical protein AOZ06_28325 [Kibdelosporangium phytohabitans]MBE1461311.1 molecular chaperone DnaK (HSP70) [Kibdelosporangium phytohabitans]
MPYRLGIDLGTTFTAAAICREAPDRTVHRELFTLGTRTADVPSVLFIGPDAVLVGAAAERRAVTDPELVVREFKRRIGDEVPILVGETPHEAHDLAASLVEWVVDRVVEREGEPPDAIAVTHPASWGPHRTALLRDALPGDVVLLTEPEAAATHYASAARVPTGATIAVYDLGGGTFDAAVVRKTDSGFELLGNPHGLDRVGGVDFDDAIVSHVLGSAPDCGDGLAMARLRRECTEAKEALSADSEAIIPVLLPGTAGRTRLTRARFESLISPILADTVDALGRAITSAGLSGEEVDAVLLVGGSSRIPLVEEMISARLGRPVAVDTDPKGVVALGAALAAHRSVVSDADSSVPVPRRPDHGCVPPRLTRPRRRLRRTKVFLGTFIMLVLALAVIPSPFTADTSPPARNNSTPAQAERSGAQANNPAQPGTTRKRSTPGRPSDRTAPDPTSDSSATTPATNQAPAAPPATGRTAEQRSATESATTPHATAAADTPTGSAPDDDGPTAAAEPPPPPPAEPTTADVPPPTTEEPPPAPVEPAPSTQATEPSPTTSG